MKVRIVLTYDNGKFGIEGPLSDKAAMYAVLGLAHEAVMKFDASQRIVTPEGVTPFPVPPREPS